MPIQPLINWPRRILWTLLLPWLLLCAALYANGQGGAQTPLDRIGVCAAVSTMLLFGYIFARAIDKAFTSG